MTATPRRFMVAVGDAATRVDALVARHLGISTAAARRLLDAGAVRVAGRPARKGARLPAGSAVEVEAGTGIAGGGEAVVVLPDPSMRLTVLYEDPVLVAVDKPAGVASHPLRSGELGTAANAIVARWPECAGASPDPREGGLAHRLDTPTSGVLLAARTRVAWTGLRQALAAPDCEKRYLCLVHGAPPDAGHIDAEIGRRGRRGRTVRVGGGRNPQPAETAWTVMARGATTCLVEARLHAGRAHQVRAHLAAAGFPLVGDDRYGEVEGAAGVGATALHLHAASIRLMHPVSGQSLFIEAPPPAWARGPAR